MLAFIEGLRIAEYGAIGVMLAMTWALMLAKDRKIYKLVDEMKKEKEEMYEGMKEIVKEVTIALVYKNTTDDKMSSSIDKLTAQLSKLKETVKENQDGRSE